MLDLFYTVIKDYWSYLKEKNTPVLKLVKADFLEKNGIQEKWEKRGYKVRGVNLDKIEERKLDGWEILYERDETSGKTYYYRTFRGLIFMCKKP